MDELTTYEQAQRAELEDQARFLRELEPYPYATVLMPRSCRWLNYTVIAALMLLGMWVLALIFG